MRGCRLRQPVAALVLAWAAAATSVLACGLEDPSSIAARRGALALAYPQSLHVGTAVWQAQLAGTLPRDPVSQREDLAPEARAVMRRIRAQAVLRQFAAQLAAPGSGPAPSLSVVLLGPVMWNRFAMQDGQPGAQLHVEGPEPGDVVVVTELAVVEAITSGRLGFAAALEGGVVRLYGEPARLARARAWLAARG